MDSLFGSLRIKLTDDEWKRASKFILGYQTCSVCKGSGKIRNPEHWIRYSAFNTVVAESPDYVCCKKCKGEGECIENG